MARKQQCYEVYFKVPSSNDPSNSKMKRFYIKILNTDVLCVHDPEQSLENNKLKFLHSLVGCHFIVKPPFSTDD